MPFLWVQELPIKMEQNKLKETKENNVAESHESTLIFTFTYQILHIRNYDIKHH